MPLTPLSSLLSVIPRLPEQARAVKDPGWTGASRGPMRPSRIAPFAIAALALLLLLSASSARAEYIVLRSGQRFHVTGYQQVGDKYRLQMAGGYVDVAVADVASIEPEDTFKPIPEPPPSATPVPPYTELVKSASTKYGVDADLISSVIAVESNFDPKAVSRKNARGLMQLLPETADRLGVKNILDPAENIDGGTRYLKELLQLYNNDLSLALAAYNAGPDKVQHYGGNVPPFRETISYVRQVSRTYAKAKSAAPAKPPTSASTPAANTPPPPKSFMGSALRAASGTAKSAANTSSPSPNPPAPNIAPPTARP